MERRPEFPEKLIQKSLGILDRLPGHKKIANHCGGQLKLKGPQNFFTDGHKPPRSRFLFKRQRRYAIKSLLGEMEIDIVSPEGFLILTEDGTFGMQHDAEKVILAQGMTRNADGKASNEFRLKTKVYKVFAGGLIQNPIT
jgi:hypothetical protein